MVTDLIGDRVVDDDDDGDEGVIRGLYANSSDTVFAIVERDNGEIFTIGLIELTMVNR